MMKDYWNIPKNAKKISWAPYYVTSDGKTIFSFLTGRAIKQQLQIIKGKQLYKQVWLKHYDGTTRWHRVHRLVAELFVVNYRPATAKEVHHKDHDKLNNNYKNLAWVTHSENIRGAIGAGGKNVFNRLSGVPNTKGKKFSDDTKKQMSLAKKGFNHPKFKGLYEYDGRQFPSLKGLAEFFGFYPMKAYRMFKKGLIGFEAVDRTIN